MRRSTLNLASRANPGIDERYIRSHVRTSPTYFEARYLRTLEWLADHSMSQQEYVLLWVFALTDDQTGFALDISVEFERIFGETESSRKLNAATRLLMKRAARRDAVHNAYAPVARRLRSVVDRLLGQG